MDDYFNDPDGTSPADSRLPTVMIPPKEGMFASRMPRSVSGQLRLGARYATARLFLPDAIEDLSGKLDALAEGMQKKPSVERLTVSASEAAEMIGIAKSTFLSKQESDMVPLKRIKLGGRVLYDVAEIKAWISAGCPSGSAWRERWEARG